MKTIAIVARKGGVGKTTTAANVAAIMAGWRVPGTSSPARVLVLDLDPQCHALRLLTGDTTAAAVAESAGGAGALIAAALAGRASVADMASTLAAVAVNPAGLGAGVSIDLDIIGGGLGQIAGVNVSPAGWLAAVALLRQAVVFAGYDWLVIDTPASGILQDFAALMAAGDGLILVPVSASPLGIAGAAQTAALGPAIGQAYGLGAAHPVNFSAWRFFGSAVDRRLSISRQSIDALADYFGVRWIDTIVPARASVNRAAAAGLPVVVCEDAGGDVAGAFGALAQNVLIDVLAGWSPARG